MLSHVIGKMKQSDSCHVFKRAWAPGLPEAQRFASAATLLSSRQSVLQYLLIVFPECLNYTFFFFQWGLVKPTHCFSSLEPKIMKQFGPVWDKPSGCQLASWWCATLFCSIACATGFRNLNVAHLFWGHPKVTGLIRTYSSMAYFSISALCTAYFYIHPSYHSYTSHLYILEFQVYF